MYWWRNLEKFSLTYSKLLQKILVAKFVKWIFLEFYGLVGEFSHQPNTVPMQPKQLYYTNVVVQWAFSHFVKHFSLKKINKHVRFKLCIQYNALLIFGIPIHKFVIQELQPASSRNYQKSPWIIWSLTPVPCYLVI